MMLADGKIYVNVPDNIDTKKIMLNDRFIKYQQAFKVVGIDRYSKAGIVILTCEKDSINTAYDNVENDIAGAFSCPVNITNTRPVVVYEGNTIQLTWTATNDYPVVFNSSDESVATVDASGFVTGVNIGQATITVQNASNMAIIDSITVNVVEAPSSYTVDITSTSGTPYEIKSNQSKTYNAEVYNNGVTLVSDGSQPVTWQLFADDQVSSTTLATITTQHASSCTVRNNASSSGYVRLRTTLQSDRSIVEWIRIQMKPIF